MKLGLLKKKQDDSAAKATPKTNSVDAADFLSPSVHYNAHTILSKNGEVMQTIRISENKNGLNYEPYDRDNGNLRDCIRRALARHVTSENVAVWIHTLRKRRAVSFQAHYDNDFATYIHSSWREKNGWSHQYYNEVYITLVYEGQGGKLLDKALIKSGKTTKKNRIMRDTYISAAVNELDVMLGSMTEELSSNYRVHRLSVVERIPNNPNLPQAPIFFSEPMEFYSYLLNLRESEVPLPDADISVALQTCELMFGFNAMETKSEDGTKRFGALLSLKRYREVPSNTVDMLLQAPMELIVTQVFHFTPAELALKEYRDQKDYFEMSGDEYSLQATGLTELLKSDRKHPTDFVQQQTTIMVLVDELKKLDDDIGSLQKAFSGLGLVCVREDIRLEEIFWSMMPGNFVFLRRRSALSTSRIGGFAKLNRFASGHSEHTFWSEPVALLPTLVNSPYFFNFHVQDNGHTLWLDFNSFNDRMGDQAMSFLLTMTHKLKPRVFYFDHNASASLWFDKMNADYHRLRTKPGAQGFGLNPFSLEHDPRNLAFLSAWCAELIGALSDERAMLKQAIEALYSSGQSRSLGQFVTTLNTLSPDLASRFAPWVGKGEYAGLFSAEQDNFPIHDAWLGIDMTEALGTAQNAVAAFAYMLHRIILSLDGKPTIIALQHAFPILQQPFFAARLGSLMEMLKENNAMMVLSVRYSESLPANPITPTLLEHCATKVIIPDDLRLEYASLFPALISADEQDLLQEMERMQGDVLIKQGEETVALRINLDHMADVAAIFHNDIKTLISAGGPYAGLPKQASYA